MEQALLWSIWIETPYVALLVWWFGTWVYCGAISQKLAVVDLVKDVYLSGINYYVPIGKFYACFAVVFENVFYFTDFWKSIYGHTHTRSVSPYLLLKICLTEKLQLSQLVGPQSEVCRLTTQNSQGPVCGHITFVQQHVHMSACCILCISYNSRMCRSSCDMPLYNFSVNVFITMYTPSPATSHPSSAHLSAPPPTSAPARVNSIWGTSRINKLSHLGACSLLQHG